MTFFLGRVMNTPRQIEGGADMSWLAFCGLENCSRNSISQPLGFSQCFSPSIPNYDIFSDNFEKGLTKSYYNKNKEKKGDNVCRNQVYP